MRSEGSVLQGTVVAQCLHSTRTICQAVFLSLHIHMAPQISMAEGPLSCDVMDFDTFITATEDTFSSIPVCNESNLLGTPNGNFNKVWQVSKGRATLKCSFFLFWHFVIGFALMDGRCCVNSFRKAKEVNKWIALKYRKHCPGFPCPHIIIWPLVDSVCVSGCYRSGQEKWKPAFCPKRGQKVGWGSRVWWQDQRGSSSSRLTPAAALTNLFRKSVLFFSGACETCSSLNGSGLQGWTEACFCQNTACCGCRSMSKDLITFCVMFGLTAAAPYLKLLCYSCSGRKIMMSQTSVSEMRTCDLTWTWLLWELTLQKFVFRLENKSTDLVNSQDDKDWKD